MARTPPSPPEPPPEPSEEAKQARREADQAVERAAESHEDALGKMADAAAAVARLVDHNRANDFIGMFREALLRDRQARRSRRERPE